MLTGLGFCRTLLCGAFEVKCREKVFLRGPADESPTRKQKPAVLQCYTPNISLVRHNTVHHRPSHALDGGRHVTGRVPDEPNQKAEAGGLRKPNHLQPLGPIPIPPVERHCDRQRHHLRAGTVKHKKKMALHFP